LDVCCVNLANKEFIHMIQPPTTRPSKKALVAALGLAGLMMVSLAALMASAASNQKQTVTKAPARAELDEQTPAHLAQQQAPLGVQPALTVTLTQPQSVQVPTRISANGNIAAWQEAIVGAQANGLRLAEVRANVGDVVKKDQVLASFAAETVQTDLAQTRANTAEAQAELSNARANAKRARDLKATGALSAQQIAQYVTAERTAKARLDAMNATVHMQSIKLNQTQVLAPDDGVISARQATVGAVVPAGAELFRLIRKGRLEWRAEVAASDLVRLQQGQRVMVTPVGGEPMTGSVRMVAPTVDPATRNGIVYVDLTANPAARAGMFARGDFNIGSVQSLTLPQSAVLLRDGFAYVFSVAKDQRVTLKKVALGQRMGDQVEVISGLEPAARVVTSGVGFLSDGDTVRVVNTVTTASAAATQ
jgi:HlyD family secretion protein